MKNRERKVGSPFFTSRRVARKGLSLVETLVVLSILVVLGVVLGSWVLSMREKAQVVGCISNVHQISQAMLTYAAGHANKLPRWNMGQPGVPGSNYVETGKNEDPPWARILIDADCLPDRSKVFVCPADSQPGPNGQRSTISYAMNSNIADHSLGDLKTPSKLILVAERYGLIYVEKRGWIKVVRDLNHYVWASMVGSEHVGSLHKGAKASFAFVDGHVEFLSYHGDPTGRNVPADVTPSSSLWTVAY